MNRKRTNIQESLDTVSQKYADNITLRTAVTAIPHLGGSIDALLAGSAAKAQKQRLLEWLDDLKQTCRKLEEERIDKKFLRSDEFETLFYETAERVRRTQEEEKRRLFCNVMVNSCLNSSPSLTGKENLARVLGDLSIFHIQVLRLLQERRTPYDLHQIGVEKGRDRAPEVMLAANDLVRYGLLYVVSGQLFHNPPVNVHMTSFGHDFLRFLANPTD